MWMDGGMWWWGWIFMVVFWGSIIGVVVWAISRVTGGRSASSPTPLDIAKARYARGEITKEEFESLKRDLA